MAIEREKILAAAQKYVEKKRYDRAVVEYERIIQEDPNDARTLLKIGDLQSKMEAHAAAVATYERVGKFYASQGFALKAIAVYKQIRELIARHVPQLEEKYAHIAPKLAELYQQLGLTSDALAALDEVASRLQRQGRVPEAIDVLRKIVELDPTNPLPHLRLAEALSRAKDADGAVLEFGVASGQLLKLGRRDDALKVLERLLQHRSDASHARIAAELYLARNGTNDGMQALAKLQICFQANPRDLDTLGLLARAFTQIGQAAKAIEVHKEMARIARDSGRRDLFNQLVTKLSKLAPNDEGVRQLIAGSEPPPADVAPATSRGAPSMADEYEDVRDGDIEDDEPENVEIEEGAPESMGARDRVIRVLSEAGSLRRAKLVGKAIEALRRGLEIAPTAVELHEMLRDILLDAGRTKEAVAQTVTLAELLVARSDVEGAARLLQEALAIEPESARAAEILYELGYELVEEPASGYSQDVRGAVSVRPSQGYDPSAPLPSYELDELDDVASTSYGTAPATAGASPRHTKQPRSARPATQAAQAPHLLPALPASPASPAARAAHPPNPASAARGYPTDPAPRPAQVASAAPHDMGAIDDPFADGPLPSFPLDGGPDTDTMARPGEVNVARPSANTYPDARPRVLSRPGMPELEAALEEAEFFASRGLVDDARTILQEQLVRVPRHPLLLERLAELDGQEPRAPAADSGTRPSPNAPGTERPRDRAFDIAESLDEGDRPSGIAPGPAFAAAGEQVDVDEVFAKFKEGVAKQIGVEDAQSHYDLGVAYKEMGLLDDAVREFDMAARDPKRACVCHSMIGMIQIERGNVNEAIDAFMRGVQTPDRSKDQECALNYEIGAAYEAKKMTKQALDYFQRSARINASFRDVQERIRRLQKPEPKQPVRAVAVGADDEFDRAFEDILDRRS